MSRKQISIEENVEDLVNWYSHTCQKRLDSFIGLRIYRYDTITVSPRVWRIATQFTVHKNFNHSSPSLAYESVKF